MTKDEHPEHLLDRALAGSLDAPERSALDLHLTACAACALHLSLATQLREATAAASRDRALNRLAIAGALARLEAPPQLSAPRISRTSLGVVAAGVLLVAGLAAAAVSRRTARVTPMAAAHESMPQGHSGLSRRPVLAAAVGATTGEASAAVVDRVTSDDNVTARLEAPASVYPSRRAEKAVPSAATLFARASDLRHSGRLDQAIEAYRVLQQRYPRTREANLSYALAGRLQLERGRPAQALSEFDRYLKVEDGFVEEALAGRAEALERLGRVREEAAVWRLVLARFPKSIYSKRAQLRLTAIDSASSSPLGSGTPGRR